MVPKSRSEHGDSDSAAGVASASIDSKATAAVVCAADCAREIFAVFLKSQDGDWYRSVHSAACCCSDPVSNRQSSSSEKVSSLTPEQLIGLSPARRAAGDGQSSPGSVAVVHTFDAVCSILGQAGLPSAGSMGGGSTCSSRPASPTRGQSS